MSPPQPLLPWFLNSSTLLIFSSSWNSWDSSTSSTPQYSLILRHPLLLDSFWPQLANAVATNHQHCIHHRRCHCQLGDNTKLPPTSKGGETKWTFFVNLWRFSLTQKSRNLIELLTLVMSILPYLQGCDHPYIITLTMRSWCYVLPLEHLHV